MIEIMIEMGTYEIYQLNKPINIGVFRKKKVTWCPGGDLNSHDLSATST